MLARVVNKRVDEPALFLARRSWMEEQAWVVIRGSSLQW